MIKFKCAIQDIKDKYPLIQSKSYKFDWLSKAARSFKMAASDNPTITTGVSKCKGIRDILSKGLLLPAWYDFSILTSEDPLAFQYAIPEKNKYNFEMLNWFSNDVAQVQTPLPSNSLQSVIKIITPWSVEISEDWSLLVIPIPYPDEPEFESTIGILEGPGSYEINPILKIHGKPGELSVFAGTPLCQLIPIHKSEPEFIIE